MGAVSVNQIDLDIEDMTARSSGDAEQNTNGAALLAATLGSEVVSVPVAMLLPGESPRLEGHDAAHVARLAEIDGPLPPILVDRRTLRVIDGMHRMMAAILRGSPTIEARFFDGAPADAFLHAVHANVAHGFPLSQADRRAAAARIIASHPHMSDRAIALVAGLGAKTVAALRRRSEGAQSAVRIGRDGRVRPVDGTEGRLRVAELISTHPKASLRELARWAGVSPATVSDVRKRLERGELPAASGPDGQRGTVSRLIPAQAQRQGRSEPTVDPAAVLEKLLRDPSLRHKEEGRQLLRLLQQTAIGTQHWSELTAVVPPHCGNMVGQLAQQYARIWTEFAEQMERQTQAAA
jgi:ParB-like chromosome segregation protein Spo0J